MAKRLPPVDVPIRGIDKVSSVLSGVAANLSRFGNKAKQVGSFMNTRLTIPIVAAGVASVKMAMDFNDSLGNIQTLLPGSVKESTERVKELKESIKDAAKTTGVGLTDISEGAYQIVSGFGDLKGRTEETILTMAKMAKAGRGTVSDAFNLVSAVTKGYGDISSETQAKVADLSFQTVKLGQTTMPELADSIGRVAPVASSLGVKLEELYGTFATATGVTGKSAEVSTQFRSAIAAISKPSEAMVALFERYNVKTGKEFIDKMGGLQGAFNTIYGVSQKANIPLGKFVESIEGQTIITALATNQAGIYTEKLKEMGVANGVLNDAVQKAMGGINAQNESVKQSIESIKASATAIGDILIPALAKLLNEYIKPAIDWFGSLDKSTLKLIVGALGVVAVLGPLASLISSVTIAVGGLRVAMAFLAANPIVLWMAAITVAIVGFGALIAWLIKKFDVLGKAARVFERIKNAVKGFLGTKETVQAASNPLIANDATGISGIERLVAGKNTTQTNNASVTLDIRNAPPGSKMSTKNESVDLYANLGFANPGM